MTYSSPWRLYDFLGVGMSIGAGEHAEQAKGIHVSSEFFRVFGVSPFIGRTFTPEEDLPNGPKVAVISYRLFTRSLGGDMRAIGQPRTIAGAPITIVGVLPANFTSEPPADVFIPLQIDPNSANQGPLPHGRRTPQARRLHQDRASRH